MEMCNRNAIFCQV